MKNKILILLVLFVSILSVALSVNVNANESEGGSSEAITAADINELNSLLDYYYNDSIYTKHTQMYVDSTKIDGDMKDYFHASVDTKERTTYYSGDSLWMSRGNGTYSYYGTSYDGEGNPNGVTNGTAYEPLVKPESIRIALRGEGKNSMDEYYVTLSDLYATEAQNWEYSNGVYSSLDEKVIDNFRNFVAPLWLATEASKNFLDLSKATIEVNDEDLVLKLWVSVTEAEGKLVEGAKVEGDHAVFSVATISAPYIIKNVISSHPYYVEGESSWPYENMFDGNLESFGWIAGNPKGSEIVIELSKEILLSDFSIYQTSGSNYDMMAANIQVSTDGIDYVDAKGVTPDEKGRDIHYSEYSYVSFETPVLAKYIKLVDLDAIGWVCIREILINSYPRVSLEGSYGVGSGNLCNIVDGDVNTELHVSSGGNQSNGAIVIDYLEVKTLNTIHLLSTKENDDCFWGFKLSYSVDGTTYYDLVTVGDWHANVRDYTHQTAQPINARYIKIEGISTLTYWIHLYEVEASLEDVVYVKPVFETVENGKVFSHFVDNNEMEIEVDPSLYSVHYSSDNGVFDELPTIPGNYSVVVELDENCCLEFNGLESGNSKKTWSSFKVVEVLKEEPNVQFSIESGVTLVIGEDNAPTVTVPEGVEYRVYYTLDGVEVSEEMPTTPGTYAINIQTIENDKYIAWWGFRWFILNEPKENPEVSFNIENGNTLTVGEDSIVVTVPEGVEYQIYYTQDVDDKTINLGSKMPTTPGTYSINVQTVENDTYNSVHNWRWFRLVAPTTEEIIMVVLVTETNQDGIIEFVRFEDENKNEIQIDSSLYEIYYQTTGTEKRTNVEDFVSGNDYQLIVKFVDGANYKFVKTDDFKGNDTKAWPWFTYTPAA